MSGVVHRLKKLKDKKTKSTLLTKNNISIFPNVPTHRIFSTRFGILVDFFRQEEVFQQIKI